MSDEKDNEDFDIRNPNGMYEEGSEEHEEYLKTTPNPKYPTRNLKGGFLKGISGNSRGKKKHSKSKVSTQRLAHFFRNNGVDSLEMIMDIARKSYNKKEFNTALRASMFVGSEMIKFAVNQEKNELTMKLAKAKEDKSSDNDEEEDDVPQFAEVVFKSFTKKAVGED